MGRKKQEGNYFFPVDVGFFSDRKIKILKARAYNLSLSVMRDIQNRLLYAD